MPFVTAVDGCRVHFTDEGSGTPVLMIPGLGGDGAFWQPIAQRMTGAFRVLTMDHRGAGKSDRPGAGYTIPAIAQDAVAVLAAAGIARAHIVGHSTGGLIAQTLALDHPSSVDRLVISGSWATPDDRFRLMFDARLALLEAGNAVAYQKLTQVLGYPPAWLNANPARIEAELAAAPARLTPVEVQKARVRMLLAYTRADELKRIGAPTLVMAAADDIMVPPSHAHDLVARISGSQLELMQGAHFFPVVAPDAYASSLRRFLEAGS